MNSPGPLVQLNRLHAIPISYVIAGFWIFLCLVFPIWACYIWGVHILCKQDTQDDELNFAERGEIQAKQDVIEIENEDVRIEISNETVDILEKHGVNRDVIRSESETITITKHSSMTSTVEYHYPDNETN